MNNKNKYNYPLNGFEMVFLNPHTRLLAYNDLNKIKNSVELFGDYNKVIILYLLQSKTMGHWVCLFKDNNNNINFFDSYGHSPDYEIDKLTKQERDELDEKRNTIQNLFNKNDVIIYSNRQLQGKGTDTCGCFVSHRLNYYNIPNKVYRHKFFNGKNPDTIVANYCLKKLKKFKM
jgi:hypothetical protein